jgi:hypothetical protein
MPLWPLRFQDANFDHRFAWCWSPLEGRSLRWIPYGMPRLNEYLERSAFFLYRRHPRTGKIDGPRGTGVLVGVPGEDANFSPEIRHAYAITCYHVALQGGGSIIRLNTSEGKSRFIEFDPDDWRYTKGGDDLAAIDVTDQLKSDTDIYYCIPPTLFSHKGFLDQEHIGIGEDGFMLGLFAQQAGKDRNLIAARFGNVSLLAADDAPIRQPHGIDRPSHIFDMRSRPGFSGSPVFIYRTPSGDLRTADQRGRDKAWRRHSRTPRPSDAGLYDPGLQRSRERLFALQDDIEIHQNTFLSLFGIHCGQYHDQVRVKKSKTPTPEANAIFDGDMLDIPNSMAVVVPAWQITDLLECEAFRQQRLEREMRNRDIPGNVARPESIAAPETKPEEDDAEHHQERFTRLVSAASKRKPKGDRT